MKYVNISSFGLNSKCHPVILNLNSVHDVKRSRYHMKMLLGDLYTYEIKSRQSGGDPFCVLCLKISNENFIEDIKHILIIYKSYCSIRDTYLPKYETFLSSSHINLKELCANQDELCQFICVFLRNTIQFSIDYTLLHKPKLEIMPEHPGKTFCSPSHGAA